MGNSILSHTYLWPGIPMSTSERPPYLNFRSFWSLLQCFWSNVVLKLMCQPVMWPHHVTVGIFIVAYSSSWSDHTPCSSSPSCHSTCGCLYNHQKESLKITHFNPLAIPFNRLWAWVVPTELKFFWQSTLILWPLPVEVNVSASHVTVGIFIGVYSSSLSDQYTLLFLPIMPFNTSLTSTTLPVSPLDSRCWETWWGRKVKYNWWDH